MNNILFTKEDIKVKVDKISYKLNLVLTDEELILLKNVNEEIDYMNFLGGRGVQFQDNLEIVFQEKLTNLKIKYKEGINNIKVISSNNNLVIYCENLNEFLKK